MGATKYFLFEPDHVDIANIAKVMAHPARVSILDYMSRNPNSRQTEIVEHTQLSQSTVRQHLDVIMGAQLVTGQNDGRTFRYTLIADRLREFQALISQFMGATHKNCC